MRKYIFPGGTLPLLREMIYHAYENDFRVLDVESLRRHYYKTLKCWYENFQKVREKVKSERGEEFVRMWDLYLCGCAAALKLGNIDASNSNDKRCKQRFTNDKMVLKKRLRK